MMIYKNPNPSIKSQNLHASLTWIYKLSQLKAKNIHPKKYRKQAAQRFDLYISSNLLLNET